MSGMPGRRPNGSRAGRGSSQQPKIFRCHLESCGKIFHDRASLKKHNTVHGDKLFQCTHDGCGKRFLDNAKLKRHMLVHTGEKPYKCELCNKRFSLDFNLKTHMRIHTGEKPFICPFQGCNKRFNQKSNLHAHQLTHHLEGGTLNPSSLLLNQLTSASGQAPLDQINAFFGCLQQNSNGQTTINTQALFSQAFGFDPSSTNKHHDFDFTGGNFSRDDTATRESHLEQVANAQLAKLIAKSGNTFEGISLQGKYGFEFRDHFAY
jgi:hypothetical protein